MLRASYVVKSGDTLTSIASAHGIPLEALLHANPQIRHADLISVGEQIHIPSAPEPAPAPDPEPSTQQARIDAAMAFFEGQGWTRAQAAGIVANLLAESGLDPAIQQHGGGPGYGLAQWEGPRQSDFAAWAGHGIHGSSFHQQLRFVQYELQHSQAMAGNALREQHRPDDASRIITRLYERPADLEGQTQHRARLAQQIYDGLAP